MSAGRGNVVIGLFVAALALRAQVTAVAALLPDIRADLSVSHTVVGLLGAAGLIVFTCPIGIAMGIAGPLLAVLVKQAAPSRPAFATGIYAGGLDAGFDHVVVATGARPKALPIPGAERGVHAVELPHETDGSRVVVIGGGFTGSETALRLAEGGAGVSLVEAGAELMRGDVVQDRLAYAARLADAGVRVLTNSRAVRVTESGVLVDGTAAEGELPADQVIVAVGYEPDRSLADDLQARAGPPVHIIGDAVAPGRVHDAIHQAYRVGRLL